MLHAGKTSSNCLFLALLLKHGTNGENTHISSGEGFRRIWISSRRFFGRGHNHCPQHFWPFRQTVLTASGREEGDPGRERCLPSLDLRLLLANVQAGGNKVKEIGLTSQLKITDCDVHIYYELSGFLYSKWKVWALVYFIVWSHLLLLLFCSFLILPCKLTKANKLKAENF